MEPVTGVDRAYGQGHRTGADRGLRGRAMDRRRLGRRRGSLPIGSKVVPFWDYLIGSYIRTPKRNYYGAYGYAYKKPTQSGTTMETLQSAQSGSDSPPMVVAAATSTSVRSA